MNIERGVVVDDKEMVSITITPGELIAILREVAKVPNLSTGGLISVSILPDHSFNFTVIG